MLRNSLLKVTAALGVMTMITGALRAENDALLNALVRKGVLTEKEAADVQEEMVREERTVTENKVKLTDAVSELRLYGDVRLRYQYDNRDYQVDPFGPGNGISGAQRSRWRFRLRLNADFKLGEQVFGGVELQTGQSADSGNQTFENGFADYPIFISKAYLGWSPTDWLTLTVGKVPNPFYTTELVWDSDINPTGITQQIAFHKLWGGGVETTTGYTKDGKAVVTTKPYDSPFELTLIAGQFIFDDNLEGGGRDRGFIDNDLTTDVYLFQTQLVASYRFNSHLKMTVAPGWLVYNAGSISADFDFNENPFRDSATVSGASRNLNILMLPGDLSFRVAGLKTKLFWDFAYNLEGRKRVENIYNIVETVERGLDPEGRTRFERRSYDHRDSIAWQVGLQFGENKKRGDWSVLTSYRETGIGAVDPNLNDSDFAGGELNMRGFRLALAYNLADYAVFGITYMPAWNLRKDLVGGEATSGNAIADTNAYQFLGVDLSVKF